MKKLFILIFGVLCSFSVKAQQPNFEVRVSNMRAILDSSEFTNLLSKYEKNRFVFHGLNWLNTPSDSIYYKATFIRFDLEMSGSGENIIYTEKNETCDVKVILKNTAIVEFTSLGCITKLNKFKMVDGLPVKVE